MVWTMEEEEAALPGLYEPPPSSAEEEGPADVSEGRLRVASYVEADAERLSECSLPTRSSYSFSKIAARGQAQDPSRGGKCTGCGQCACAGERPACSPW